MVGQRMRQLAQNFSQQEKNSLVVPSLTNQSQQDCQPSTIQEDTENDFQTQWEGLSRFTPNFAHIPAHAPGRSASIPIQAKLTIGQPNDKYEEEADRVAARVVNQINAPHPSPHKTVQRQEPDEEEDDTVRMKSAVQSPSDGIAVSSELEAEIGRSRSGGQPLDDGIRQPMERAFGADFSRVKVHTDAQADQLNRAIQAKAFTTGQNMFFRRGAYEPARREGQELIAHELAHVMQQGSTKAQYIQRYTVFAAGGGPGQYNQSPGNVFSSQVTAPGAAGFLDPLTGQPRINNALAPAVRISANGLLAVEDANLLNTQPKHFYADPGQIAAWNDTLIATGSYIRLLTDPGMTLTFTLPGAAAAQTLVKVFARNVVERNQGNAMTIAQQCESTIKEVIGVHYSPENSFLNAPAMVVPPGPNQGIQEEALKQYYIAAELAQTAGVGGANGGMPVGGLSLANPVNFSQEKIDIAHNYGLAMYNHRTVAANPALAARLQNLGVNQYAVPEVGEGLVTNSLGANQPGGGVHGPNPIREDRYNNRNIVNPGNNSMWNFHWGGVVAKDGSDYITLENYARNVEGAGGNMSADPRFYFQMYGAGNQSWHEAWAAIGGGGREFSNPLTMKVVPDANPNANQGFNTKARRAFGNNVNAVKDDYGTVATANSTNALTVALLKGLAYANARLNGNGFGRWNRINQWRNAVNAALGHVHATPQTNTLATYVLQQLNRLKRNPFKR